MQEGDVVATFADVSELKEACDFEPKISLDEGINKWLEWYLKYKK
jgi:UDP-glucuronate 4-epimerase